MAVADPQALEEDALVGAVLVDQEEAGRAFEQQESGLDLADEAQQRQAGGDDRVLVVVGDGLFGQRGVLVEGGEAGGEGGPERHGLAPERVADQFAEGGADRFFVAQADLELGGVDVDVDPGGGGLDDEGEDRVAPAGQDRAVGRFQGVEQAAWLDPAVVDDEVDLGASRPRRLRPGDDAAQPGAGGLDRAERE